MNAIVYDKRNAPEALNLRNIDKPFPKATEVLVKIHAVSINAADYRSMKMGIIPKNKIFGSDIAGQVEAIGTHVKTLKVGDNVMADLSGCGFGGFAEYVAVPESALLIKPDSISFIEAAALPMAAVTALQGLRDSGNIQAGQKVLIYGAGGGVGTFAIQLAKYFGAHVTAVCSTRNIDLARSLGADHVIDYSKDNFAKNRTRYDLIAVVNGRRALLDYHRALTPTGICVLVGGSLSQLFAALVLGRFLSLGSKKFRLLSAKPNPQDLAFINQLVVDAKVKPVIDRCFPLEDTASAVRYLSEGVAQGKVVITMG